MAVVGYVRVSTQKQDMDNQLNEIARALDIRKLGGARFVSEMISSRKEDRKIFDLVDELKEGDILITTELSRLARSLMEVLKIINTLIEKKVRVIVIKENFDVYNDNPAGMLMIHIMGAFYQYERSMISMRTKEAIRSKKDAGITVGRTKGSKNKSRKLDGKESKIKEYLDKGMKKTEIARMLEVDRSVLYDKLAEMGVKSDV